MQEVLCALFAAVTSWSHSVAGYSCLVAAWIRREIIFFFFFSRKLITNSIMCLVLELKMSCNISVLKSTSAKLSSSVCTGGNTNQTHTRASLQTRVQEHPMANSLGNIFSGSNKQVHFTHRLAGIGSLK